MHKKSTLQPGLHTCKAAPYSRLVCRCTPCTEKRLKKCKLMAQGLGGYRRSAAQPGNLVIDRGRVLTKK
jgi:hypothetical protein